MITAGTKELFAEIRYSSDGDEFGTVQAWRFAIADVLYVADDTCVEGYTPARLGVVLDEHEHHQLVHMISRDRIRVTIDDLKYVIKVLGRARAILAALGKDY
jgi:hypothetical protein